MTAVITLPGRQET